MSLTESQKVALTEYIGECWHRVVKGAFGVFWECLCGFQTEIGEGISMHLALSNRTFLTGNDMVAVKEAIEKKGEWEEFIKYCDQSGVRIAGNENYATRYLVEFTNQLFRPTDEAGEPHFARLMCEWKGWL